MLRLTIDLKLYLTATIFCAWLFSAGTLANDMPDSEKTGTKSSVNKQAMAELPEGRYEIMTDKLFKVYDTHFTDKLSFPGLSEWERRLSRDYGFDYAFVNAPIFQVGSEGRETYVDNEMDLYMQWRVNTGDNSQGTVFFWGTWVQTFSSLKNGEFSQSQGLITTTISAGTDPKDSFTAPSAFWWQQSFDKSGFLYRAGQLYATSLWGNNQYTFDDREGFMNSVLSNNVGLPWADTPRGLGIMVQQTFGNAYIAAGFQDAKAKQDTIDFDSFTDGKYLYAGEIGYNTNLNSEHEGRYKLAVGYVERTSELQSESDDSGWGLALSARQDVSKRIGLFAQYRRSMKGRVALGIKTAANAGIVFRQPFGYRDDALGIGFLYASPSDDAQRKEYGGEIYWRLQLTPRLDITPDLQVYRPGQEDAGSVTVVGALRFRYVL